MVANESPELHGRGVYLRVQGYVMHISDQMDRQHYYLSCVTCKKKVIQESAGYHCENCQKTYGDANPQYNFSAKIGDYSDAIYISFLGEVADSLLGMTAKEFCEMQSEGQNMSEIFKNATFRPVDLVVRAQMRTSMQGEERMNFMAVRTGSTVQDPVAESRQLLKKLEIYKAK